MNHFTHSTDRAAKWPGKTANRARVLAALAIIPLLATACGGVESSTDDPDAAIADPADAAPVADAMIPPDAAPVCDPLLALIRFDTRFDIFTVKQDGTELTNLTNSADDNDVRPEWSPNGEQIAFVMTVGATPGVNVMDADGSNSQLIVDGGFHKWSPSGAEIVFTRTVGGLSNVYKVNADGTNEVQLTTAGGTEPLWTPNGNRIIFQSERDGDLEIFSMNSDGSAETNLTNNDVFDDDPAISPNGTRIVFRSGPTFSTTNIRVMDIDGSNATSFFVGGVRESVPSYSPDGTKIVFQTNNAVIVSGADGSNPITVAAGSFPSWSPNGDAIAYQDAATTGAGIADPNVADSGVAITDSGSSASIVWQPCP